MVNEKVFQASSRPMLISQLKQVMATFVHMKKFQSFLQFYLAKLSNRRFLGAQRPQLIITSQINLPYVRWFTSENAEQEHLSRDNHRC